MAATHETLELGIIPQDDTEIVEDNMNEECRNTEDVCSDQNQNHSTHFPRNNISAQSPLRFVCVRDSDLFATKLWICSVWPKLYWSDIEFVFAGVIRCSSFLIPVKCYVL